MSLNNSCLQCSQSAAQQRLAAAPYPHTWSANISADALHSSHCDLETAYSQPSAGQPRISMPVSPSSCMMTPPFVSSSRITNRSRSSSCGSSSNSNSSSSNSSSSNSNNNSSNKNSSDSNSSDSNSSSRFLIVPPEHYNGRLLAKKCAFLLGEYSICSIILPRYLFNQLLTSDSDGLFSLQIKKYKRCKI